MNNLSIDANVLIDTLLGEDTNAEIVDAVCKRLTKIVLPWRKDGWGPARYVRTLACGIQVGLVDSHLGSYGDAHHPRHHGWGYKGTSPRGQGVCTGGIVEVDWDHGMSEAEIKEQEATARREAQRRIDAFLRKEFPDLVLLEENE